MKMKVKKAVFVITSAVMILCVAAVCINLYIVNSTKGDIYIAKQITSKDYDCIIVLGAGVRADNSVSSILRDRLDTGINLYQNGIAPKIIMSGDHGTKGYDEVNVMKKYTITNAHIPSYDIFMDHAGFSTYESIYRARDVFKVKKAVIVTQKFHLPRALYIARSLGVEAVGVSADLHIYRGREYLELREFAARVKEFVNLIVKPEPRFLGEAILVTGNGNITNDK